MVSHSNTRKASTTESLSPVSSLCYHLSQSILQSKPSTMDLVLPSNSCSSVYRKSEFSRRFPPSCARNILFSSYKCRRRMTSSELQSVVAVDGGVSSNSSSIPTHKVTVHDRQRGVVHEFLVPEDQYILHTAEAQNISLPFACRHGCCTSCAVRIKSGQLRQPEALGISAELKSKGYALLCVGFPSSDIEVETQDEDEVYWLQFGRYFARGPIERDDYALELAMADE